MWLIWYFRNIFYRDLIIVITARQVMLDNLIKILFNWRKISQFLPGWSWIIPAGNPDHYKQTTRPRPGQASVGLGSIFNRIFSKIFHKFKPFMNNFQIPPAHASVNQKIPPDQTCSVREEAEGNKQSKPWHHLDWSDLVNCRQRNLGFMNINYTVTTKES